MFKPAEESTVKSLIGFAVHASLAFEQSVNKNIKPEERAKCIKQLEDEIFKAFFVKSYPGT